MSDEKKLPKRRFKQFLNTPSWEQRKLTDISKTFIGLVTTMTTNYREEGTLLIRNSDIRDNKFIFSEKPIYLDSEFAKSNESRKLKSGDVVTVHTGDIGTSAVVEEDIEGAIGFATINTRPDINYLDSDFLSTYFNTESHKKYAISVATGDGRSNYNIKDFNKLMLYMPSVNEQKAIAEFIKRITNLITLHQRKLNKLEKLKKAYLEELFPTGDQRKPTRRFKEFNDDWEQRKLGEITEIITKGTTPIDKSGQGEISFIKVENIDPFNCEINSCTKITKKEHEGYLRRSQLKSDDILFSIAGTLGRIGVVTEDILPANTNQALAIIRLSNGDVKYITKVLGSKVVEEYIRKNPTVGAQPNLSLEQVSNLIIPYPSDEEQIKLGVFFKAFDNLITLHQRKLKKLKKLKEAYLDELFV